MRANRSILFVRPRIDPNSAVVKAAMNGHTRLYRAACAATFSIIGMDTLVPSPTAQAA